MRRVLVRLAVIVLVVALGVSAYLYWAMQRPEVWESSIRAFEQSDRVAPPKPGGIVFTGSSSILLWDTLAEDMRPLGVINRGFGGSQIAQVNYYVHRIVIPYRPKAVVLYCGDNDLSWPALKSPETVLRDFQRFVEIVHRELPETWIYYISIKPSVLRWGKWPKMKKANALIETFSRTQERVQFIDVSSAMLDSEGKPRRDLLQWDGLHPNSKCYQLWTSIIKPVLMERFGPASETLLLSPFAAGSVRRDLALVFRKDKALSRAALAFIDIAVKHKSAQELVPASGR